jgi:hypothetical protein
MAEFAVPNSILQSFQKMGLTAQNKEGFRALLKQADERRLRAMDPNASKFMSEEEKLEALNAPERLLNTIGGFQYKPKQVISEK